ncbi:Calcineurin-like phosphoesterase, partial [Phytophthora megakarya]
MKVVCVSDTHGLHDDALVIPDGDVFVHAGDFTDTGERSEVVAFNEFLGRLPHRYKLVIAGNHESSFDRTFYPQFWHQYGHCQQYDPDEVRALLTNALYLEDEAVLIEGFLFYGTPWQPEFCNWAFNLPRGDALLQKWRHIPTDTDVLITHTPPMGHGDLVGYQRPVNPPFVFELRGPPKRGYLKHTVSLTTPNPLGIRRNFSCNDVSSISSLSTTEDEDVDMEATLPIEAEPKDYDLMLHEWLRRCSHKPPFIEKKLVQVETCEVNGKGKLREFRVDGTTSGLLFESTLKLRPVMNVQKRALRYLFSQGFRSNTENYKAEEVEGEKLTAQNENVNEDAAAKMEVDNDTTKPTRDRRNYGISRRVTMAVLDDINEVKEGMDDRDREHVQHARVAAAALAIPKLASLTEEPNEAEGSNAITTDKPPMQEKVSEDVAVVEAIVVDPPV